MTDKAEAQRDAHYDALHSAQTIRDRTRECEHDDCAEVRADGSRFCKAHAAAMQAFILRTQERRVDHS